MFIGHRLLFNSIYFMEVSSTYTMSAIIWLSLTLLAHFEFIRYYRVNQIGKKKETLFAFVGILGFLGGTMNFLPFYNIAIYPYGNFSVSVYSIIITYAILKHQLLDIDVVIKKSLAYSFLIALITIFYVLIVLVLEKLLQEFFGYHSILTSIITAVLLVIILVPLRNKIQQFIDRLFFKGTQVEIAEQNELLRQEVAKTEKLKAVATLASGMAHEIKNPLTAIKTFSEFLPQKLDDKEFLKKFAPLLNHEVERINQLVNNLLDFARPIPLKPEATDIHALMTSTLNFLDNQFVQNKINVTYDFYTSSPVLLKVDPNQLKQAFLNLFLNAIEAMPEGGTLTISTRLDLTPNPHPLNPDITPKTFKNLSFPNALVGNPQEAITRPPTKTFGGDNLGIFTLIIKDTGGGIHPDDLPHIFDPFFTKKDSGTGLGLSVTHGIIAQHGGRIWGESVVGEGAVFIVELPLLDKERENKDIR